MRSTPKETVKMADLGKAAIPSVEQSPPDIRGLVDNATAERLFGWVWDAARPGGRVTVELRLSGATVARAVADLARPDLAKAGVGDGCHAFEFGLTPEWLERRTELSVVAMGGDGRDYPIVMRVRQSESGRALLVAQQPLEALANAQRQLAAEVQTLALRLAELSEAAEAQQVLARQDTQQQRLDQLEVWLTRLDAHLARAAEANTPQLRRAFDPWQIVLFVILAIGVAAATAGPALIGGHY